MISENNSLCLEQFPNKSTILRRRIRVSSSKLPSDFFHSRQLSRYQPSLIKVKKSLTKDTRQTNTPTFERDYKLNLSNVKHSLLSERKIETARVNMNKDDTLINEVISTARNLRRVLRKKSLQMVRDNDRKQEERIELPRIKVQRGGKGLI